MGKITEGIAAQRGRLFLWAPVFFGGGIGLYFALLREPALWVGMAAVLPLAGALFAARIKPVLLPGVFLLFLFALGFSAAQIRTHHIHAPMIKKKLGPVEITATIDAIEALEEGKGARLMLSKLTIEKLSPEETPRKIRLTTRKPQEFTAGERLTVLAQLNPPSPPVAPSAFDFQRHTFFQQIGAVGFIYKKISSEGAVKVQTNRVEDLRNIIAARMNAVISPRSAPMAIAFTNGQRTAISEVDNEAMRNSGLYHLISISGLHIGLFSALVFFAVRLGLALIPGMALHYPIKKYAAIFGFAAAAFYTILAGASIPTQRSLIMVGMAYLAIMLDRSPLSLRLVAFSALAIMFIAPESLVSVSFQMSFGAIACLILAYDAARPWLMEWYREAGWFIKAGLYMAGVCATTLIATIATAPFSLFHFQNLAMYGLIGNALAVPLTSFIIMPAIVLSLLLMPVHLEYLALKILDWGTAILLDIAHDVASLPNAVLHVAAWPIYGLILIIIGFIFFSLWNGTFRWAGMLPIAAAVIIVMIYKQPDILISQPFDVAAYRGTDNTLYVSGLRKNKFSIENWEKMAGLPKKSAQPWPREGSNVDMNCDSDACRVELKGQKISFLRKPQAITHECE